MTTSLTEHFTLDELIASSTATRLCIDNTPPQTVIDALKVAATGAEQVRALLGFPMHIDSGYRCPELNSAVHGASNSAHMIGFAIDFICPEFGTPLDIVKAIQASDIAFDQCIAEGNWCHISFAPMMRRQVLTAHFGAGGTSYTDGLAVV